MSGSYVWGRRVDAAAKAIATAMGSDQWQLFRSEAIAALKASDQVLEES